MLRIGIIAFEAATEAASYERIFGLDAQLIHDVLWTALAIFILFFALSYLLFNPARKMLEQRKKKISDELEEAGKKLQDAESMKAEYDAKMAGARAEVSEIMDNARKKAMRSENEIIEEAKEEANLIRRRALQEVELEKEHARDDVKKEMVTLASQIAGKVVSDKMTPELQDELIQETLNSIGNETWQNQ